MSESTAAMITAFLKGEPVDLCDLAYPLEDAWHVGVVVSGYNASAGLAGIASDTRAYEVLSVPVSEDMAWAWLGSAQRSTVQDESGLLTTATAGTTIAVGEPRKGIEGWRLTHEEAQAALPVALRRDRGLTRYADVLVEAALLKDKHLADLLREIYLAPLDDVLRRPSLVRDTLRTYFAADQNVKVTAARLGVNRRTVWYRLDKIEKRLGYPPGTRRVELEIALRLAELDAPVAGG